MLSKPRKLNSSGRRMMREPAEIRKKGKIEAPKIWANLEKI